MKVKVHLILLALLCLTLVCGCKQKNASESQESISIIRSSSEEPTYKRIFGDMLDAYENLNIYSMNRQTIAQELQEYSSEVVGKKIPIREDNVSEGMEIESVVIDSWVATNGSLNFVMEFVPSYPEGLAKQLKERKSFGVFFFLCTEDGKIINAGVAGSFDGKHLRAPMIVKHDKVKYWRHLGYVKMVDRKVYDIRERRVRGSYY